MNPIGVDIAMVGTNARRGIIPSHYAFMMSIQDGRLCSGRRLFTRVRGRVDYGTRTHSFHLGSSHVRRGRPFIRGTVGLKHSPFNSPALSSRTLVPFPSIGVKPKHSSHSRATSRCIVLGRVRRTVKLCLRLLSKLDLWASIEFKWECALCVYG